MKNLILIICLLNLNTIAFSQDSIKIRTEIDTFNKSNYEGQFDYVFARKEAKKYLLKSGILNALSGGNLELLSYEKKIHEDISLHFSVNMPNPSIGVNRIIGYREIDTAFYESAPTQILSFEPRWYFNMKRAINNGLIANNFHGNYLGLRMSYGLESRFTETRLNKDSSKTISPSKKDYNRYISSELGLGIQRRILRNRYIDFGISTGIRTRIKTEIPTDQKQTQWIFNYHLAYGYILNTSPKGKNDAIKCEALRCFEEEKSMWKVSLSNLIHTLNERQFTGLLSIAYEQKIPNTTFSVESSMAIGGNLHSKSDEKVSKNENKYGFTIAVMPRYYYTLKQRIAKGESANNLSGKYWGIKLDYGKAQKFDNAKIQSSSASLVWGLQQRILQHLNFDWWLGYGAYAEEKQEKTNISGRLAANLALGLAF